MVHLLFRDLLYQGIQTPRNRQERKDGAFIVSRCLDALMNHKARVVHMTPQSGIINQTEIINTLQAKFVCFSNKSM